MAKLLGVGRATLYRWIKLYEKIIHYVIKKEA